MTYTLNLWPQSRHRRLGPLPNRATIITTTPAIRTSGINGKKNIRKKKVPKLVNRRVTITARAFIFDVL